MITERVLKMVSTQLDLSYIEIKSTMALVNDLGFDSLDFIELIMDLEEVFEVEIDESVLSNESTVQDIIDLINRELGN